METRLKSFTRFIGENLVVSPKLQYHIDNDLSITESVFRPGSDAHLWLLEEARSLHDSGKISLGFNDNLLFEETDIGRFGTYYDVRVPLDFVFENTDLNEAEYKGKEVQIGKPQRGGAKKYHVYVLNPKAGRVKLISFGDVHGGLTAKVSNPKARKSFAARHRCAEKTDRTTAGYWACRINRYAHLWGGKTYPGFW